MDFNKLTHLRQHEIAKPCPKQWEDMEGEGHMRLCQDCGCHVFNIAEMSPTDAEELLTVNENACTVVTSCKVRGILTRDGWIPRLLAAGAVAATMSGCQLVAARASGGPRSKTAYKKMADIAQEIYDETCKDPKSSKDKKDCKDLKKNVETYRRESK